MTHSTKTPTSNQIVAKEGFKPIILSAILVFLCIFLHSEFLAMVCLLVCLFFIVIFRNPERILQYRNDDAIIAPCDGIIKDITFDDKSTLITIKINIFDVGILRNPMLIDSTQITYKYGLFITQNTPLKSKLNTKHHIFGFCNNNLIYDITLLPEIWNKVTLYNKENIYINDRIGFMKYGYLLLKIHLPCTLKAEKGQNIFAGETLLGKIYEN